MELFKASNQWATRPADERFADLQSMYEASKAYETGLLERPVNLSKLRAEVTPQGIALRKPDGPPAHLTFHGFGQLCTRLQAPAGYLRDLPATLAAQNLNFGLSRIGDDESLGLLHRNDRWDMLSVTSQKYERIHNSSIIEFLLRLNPERWKVPPSATDHIQPSGLYLSQRDMFAFMVSEATVFEGDGGHDMVNRGFFISNAIDGTASLAVTMFYYQFICGNHIVWGASHVKDVRIKHMGERARSFTGAIGAMVNRLNSASAIEDTARIKAARVKQIAAGRTETIDDLFNRSLLSRTRAGQAYDKAEEYVSVHGKPNTPWGIASALTRLSQESPFGDERTTLDRAAGKVLEAYVS